MSRNKDHFHNEIVANSELALWLEEQEQTRIELYEIGRGSKRHEAKVLECDPGEVESAVPGDERDPLRELQRSLPARLRASFEKALYHVRGRTKSGGVTL